MQTAKGSNVKYINLISGPRNISTALMYSFAQRPDTAVLDEPFYAVYLSKSGANHPGTSDVLASLPSDEQIVLKNIFKPWSVPIVFIKNMAHHIEVLNKSFLKDVTNVFLIRDPKQIIASYAEVIHEPQMRDIGIQHEYELFEELSKLANRPIVVDSGLILENPKSVLTKLCDAIDIQFNEAMLRWPAGPKPYDGVWAPHWYSNVHKSSGFERQPTSFRALPSHLIPLYESANYYYEKLLSFTIRP
jgi:hypothetical protein